MRDYLWRLYDAEFHLHHNIQTLSDLLCKWVWQMRLNVGGRNEVGPTATTRATRVRSRPGHCSTMIYWFTIFLAYFAGSDKRKSLRSSPGMGWACFPRIGIKPQGYPVPTPVTGNPNPTARVSGDPFAHASTPCFSTFWQSLCISTCD